MAEGTIVQFRKNADNVLEVAKEIQDKEGFDNLLVLGIVGDEHIMLATKNMDDPTGTYLLLQALGRIVLGSILESPEA